MKEKDKKQELEDFAKYCHTRYLGCERNDTPQAKDGYQYCYDTLIVCMIGDYLKKV